MPMLRREFIRQSAAAAAGAVAGIPMPVVAQGTAPAADADGVKWSKAPCRFCGTGCGVNVAVKDNRVVATHGDPQGRGQPRPQLRQGLLPVQDHVRRGPPDDAAAAHEGRQVRQGRRVRAACRWDQAFDVMAEKFKRALKEKGPTAVGMFGSGQWTIWEGYAALKLMKAGFRSNNLDPNARHCMASAAVGFMRTFGMDEPMGCYDDIEAADAFVLWGSNMAEMHPILWTRVTDRRLSAPHVKVAVLSTFEHRCYELADIAAHLHAADRPRDPQLHRATTSSRTTSVEPRFRRQAHALHARQRRHRLRPAARASAAEGGEERRRRRRRRSRSTLRRVREVRRAATTSSTRRQARAACPKNRLRARWPSCTPTRRSR